MLPRNSSPGCDALFGTFFGECFITRALHARAAHDLSDGVARGELPLAAAFARAGSRCSRACRRWRRGTPTRSRRACGDAPRPGARGHRGRLLGNETKDDVPTENLRYVLAPWYLAELASRARRRGPRREEHALVEVSAMYEAFLERCERHGYALRECQALLRARRRGVIRDGARREGGPLQARTPIRQEAGELDATRRAHAWRSQRLTGTTRTPRRASRRRTRRTSCERWLLLGSGTPPRRSTPAAATELAMLARRAEAGDRRSHRRIGRRATPPAPHREQRDGQLRHRAGDDRADLLRGYVPRGDDGLDLRKRLRSRTDFAGAGTPIAARSGRVPSPRIFCPR